MAAVEIPPTSHALGRPRWRTIVWLIVGVGSLATAAAAVHVSRTGLERPWVFLAGLAATAAMNYLYVLTLRRGQALEAIDMAEAPIVALALLLPAGAALLAFVLGSLLGEFARRRAPIKKAFNVGIRAAAGACFLLVMAPVGHVSDPGTAQVVVAIVGAAVYAVIGAAGFALVIASVENVPVVSRLPDDLRSRTVVWAVSVAVGLAAAALAPSDPLAAVGLVAPLLVVRMTAAAALGAQRDRDRLEQVLAAGTQIQAASGPAEQEAALLAAARELLLWRDIEVRERPPGAGEAGGRLWLDTGGERWLVAVPRSGSDPWTEEDGRILAALTSAASAALDRAHLQDQLVRQAMLDPLTGLANRRHFDEVVAGLLGGPEPEPLTLLVIDLDRFKQVNDRLGHDVGDELLTAVAGRLAAAVRDTDLVARLGGDEFAVLLPGMGSVGAATRAAAVIRERFEDPLQLTGWRLHASLSIGWATAPYHGTSAHDVLRHADQAMYRTKRERAESPSELVALAADTSR